MDSQRKRVTLRRDATRNVPGPHHSEPSRVMIFAQSAPATARQLRLAIEREMRLATQARLEAEKYRRETEARARSDAQRLLLDTRLSIKREISELELEASKQVKKLLVEIHMIRLAAQGEFEAQRQFTSAAKISALSSASHGENEPPPEE